MERLTVRALAAAACRGLLTHGVRYFEVTASGRMAAWWLVVLGVLPARPQQATFVLGQILDDTGSSASGWLIERTREICLAAAAGMMGEPFASGVGRMFDHAKVELFLAKTVEEDIARAVVYIEVAAVDTGRGGSVLLRRRPWSGHLRDFAAERGVEAHFHAGSGKSARSVAEITERLLRPLAALGARRRRRGSRKASAGDMPRAGVREAPGGANPQGPVLAAGYTGRTITFDHARRSELFWLEPGHLDHRRILLYTNRPTPLLSGADLRALAERQVRAVATRRAAAVRGLPLYRPGPGDWFAGASHVVRVLVLAVACALRGTAPTRACVAASFSFALKYAAWRGFFERYRVRVHLDLVNHEKSGPARNLALEHAGGVSVSYQWSNLSVASLFSAGTSDAFFAFGPAYRGLFETMGSRFGRMLYSGYVTDHAFRAASGSAAGLRESLMSRGARFIVAFFDENSADVPMSCMTNAELADVYAELLRRVIEDPEFGLVIKPGYPLTLDSRLASIRRLRERAEQTGRCVHLSEGSYLTEAYPAEAAQASDVAVGLMGSGTTVLESFLAGTPAVFLNLGPRTHHDPISAAGAGSVVFRGVPELLEAIDRFRSDPGSVPGFGDLSAWVAERDPFRDGRAAERLNSYMGWLLDAFVNGMEREEALREADTRYRAAWGDATVVVGT